MTLWEVACEMTKESYALQLSLEGMKGSFMLMPKGRCTPRTLQDLGKGG